MKQFLVAVLSLISFVVYSADFQRHNLANGISISIPSSWYVLNKVDQKIVKQRYETYLKDSKLEWDDKKKRLLLVNSDKKNPRAIIRVSWTQNESFINQDWIQNANEEELEVCLDFFRDSFQQMYASADAPFRLVSMGKGQWYQFDDLYGFSV